MLICLLYSTKYIGDEILNRNKNIKNQFSGFTVLFILVLFFTSTISNAAFGIEYTYRGEVRNEDGTVLNNVKIELLEDLQVVFTTYTGSDGKYEFAYTPNRLKIYRIRASKYPYETEDKLALNIPRTTICETDFVLIYIEKFAVLVGINEYQNVLIPPLACPHSDVNAWYYFLEAYLDFPEDNLYVFGDQNEENYFKYTGIATKSNVVNKIQDVMNEADSTDIVAFIFSGHGGINGGAATIIMWDEYQQLHDWEIVEIVERPLVESPKIFAFIETCHSGGFVNGPWTFQGTIIHDLTSMSNSEKVYATTPCDFNGGSWESSILDSGLWTYFFLDMTWIGHYGGAQHIPLEDIYDVAKPDYVQYLIDNYLMDPNYHNTPQEFDGNPNEWFDL